MKFDMLSVGNIECQIQESKNVKEAGVECGVFTEVGIIGMVEAGWTTIAVSEHISDVLKWEEGNSVSFSNSHEILTFEQHCAQKGRFITIAPNKPLLLKSVHIGGGISLFLAHLIS